MSFAGLDGKIMSVNPAYCELLGYAAEDLKSMSVYDVTLPEDVAATMEAQRQMMAGEAADVRFETRFLRKEGEPMWADVAVRRLRHVDAKPVCFPPVIYAIRVPTRASAM